MERIDVEIVTEFINLNNLLKFSGVIESGGQANEVITAGLIKLNDVVVTEKRKKVYPGDVVNVDGEVEILVTK